MATKSEIEELQSLLFNPKEYRVAFKFNAEDGEEGEIFEVLRDDIVKYAKSAPSFKEYLIKNLVGVSVSPVASVVRGSVPSHSFTPRLRNTSVFSPRSSSRPTVD